MAGGSIERVLLGKKLSEALDALPMSPRSLPFATHASLAGSCRHLAEDLPGLWSALLGGAQQARGARSSPPSTKDWRALPPSGRVSPGVSPAAAPGPCGGVGLWLPTAFWCLTVYLVLAACLSPALSHLAMSLQAFPENPSQVNTLPLNPGLWDCFTEQFRELKPGHQWTDISLQKSIFFFFALT